MKTVITADNIPYERITQSIEIGIFDNLHIGVALISDMMEILYCNAAFAGMYELPADAHGNRLVNIILPERKGVVEHLKQHKIVACLNQPQSGVYCIFMGYPVYSGKIYKGTFIQVIPMAYGKATVNELLDSMRSLDMKTYTTDKRVREKSANKGLTTFDAIIGNAPQMKAMLSMGTRVAASNDPILIYGESGTGKELVAQALHMASLRSDGPFVCVNCAALPADLMESELFGYEAGSFTGARTSGMKGKFEEAHNGTIFLDEIGEMPLAVQAKLLRVLESGEIQKIGHKGRLSSNFRLLAATNKNLLEMVHHGTFREDLYHRLNVFELVIPPLRDRGDDLFLLIRHFMEMSIGIERSLKIKLESDLVTALRQYPWPGNVRELKNIMTHALFLMDDSELVLGMRHLPPRFQKNMHPTSGNIAAPAPAQTETAMQKEVVQYRNGSEQQERQLLQDALVRCQYNKVRVTRELGISRSKLYRDLKKHGLLTQGMQG